MKVTKEIRNGFFIFIGIGIYFLLMELLGLQRLFYLRLLNVFIVVYWANKTIESRVKSGQKNFFSNAVAIMTTCFVGVFLSIVGLVIYSYMRGGDVYIKNLSQTFLFGGDPSIPMYCITLLFEGVASSVIVTMILMLYWNNKHISD